MTEEQKEALRNFERIGAILQKGTAGKAAYGHEKAYSDAYQVCVRLGIKPQIKKKYR